MAITFPSNPNTNDTHTVNGRTWVWDGATWKLSGTINNGISLEVSDTAPATPIEGDMWYDSSTGSTFTYYDSVWVELGNTASVVSFIADADGDTRVHVEESVDDDTIRFDTAGVERLTITSAGHVLPSADVTYDLGSTSYRFRDLYLSGSSIDLGGVTISSDGTSLSMPPISSVSGDFTVDTNTLHVDSTNDRVGINTTSPNYDLAVVGTAYVSGNLTVDQGSPTVASLHVDATNNRVGIGTTSPSYKLDVNGDINTTGALRTDGKKTGLVLLTSGDVSSGGPITFTSLFSSEFDNYVVYISELTCTGQNAIYYRTASGGSWNTSSVYSNQRIYGQTTSIGAQRFSSTYAQFGYAGARESNYEITFFSPYLSTQTAVISRGAYSDNTNAGFIELHHSYVDNTTSYDGFVFDEVTGSASISCRYEVYGIPK